MQNTMQAPTAGEPGSMTQTRPAALLAGMLVATDLDGTRRFYEEFLGLECVRCAPDRLLARDPRPGANSASEGTPFVFDVRRVTAIENPQRMLHHWGFSTGSSTEVDRIHAVAKARREDLGISKLFPVSDVHGAHSFYLADRDMNWWEVENRLDGIDNEGIIARGDRVPDASTNEPKGAPVKSSANASLAQRSVLGDAHLSHGTCEQLVLERSRAFVEQVLRLRCVRHLEPAQIVAGRGSFGIFGIRLPRVKEQARQNRWIVGVDTADEVVAAHARAVEAQATAELRHAALTPDGLSCTIQDADGNWWEVVAAQSVDYSALFARGDVLS